ncbi:MAG: ribonuclease Z [Chitinophagales bacterium]|nr:ribonuclease Z [Chitinophagales bacterium]
MFAVTILGNNSALPAYDRHPTAQVVTLNDQLFLIDCGEGTQMQMARYKIRRSKINHIFISHLHGDHYFGLIGLLTSMGLLGRDNPLHLYAPAPLEKIIALQLEAASTTLPFTLHFHPVTRPGQILDNPKFSVEAFATQHRIPCFGYIIREKRNPRRIHKENVVAYNIPAAFYDQLKQGADYVTKDGTVIQNELVTLPNLAPRSYAFCADTIYDEQIAETVRGVNLLYHETTYLADQAERAASRFHTTTAQAAAIASKAGAEKLLIGHFSSKYETLDAFLAETKQFFPQTQLATEGTTFLI